MIVGAVNASREAAIRLHVRGTKGRVEDVRAILDTGFNGSLTLPPTVIATLKLPWRTRGLVTLANGTQDQWDTYAATVLWDGKPREILVDAADIEPLVGMALLYGHNVSMEVIEGGRVTIEARP